MPQLPAPRDQPRLLPRGWRRVIGWMATLCVLGVAALGWQYAGARRAGRLDTAIDDVLIEHGEPHRHLLWPIAELGSPPALLLGVVVLAALARRCRRPRAAVALAVAGPVLAALTTELALKPLVDRTHEGGLALPSGHATSITAQVTVFLVVFVASGFPRRTWLRRGLAALAVLVPIGVSVAMVSLERHYATDTAAGVLVGACVVGVLALLVDRRVQSSG